MTEAAAGLAIFLGVVLALHAVGDAMAMRALRQSSDEFLKHAGTVMRWLPLLSFVGAGFAVLLGIAYLVQA